jgi:glycosyltransferase involved in cell wall biosynthesis
MERKIREKNMRIAFVVIGNSRRSNYLNGDTLRYGGGGGSGTDTSSIIVAEYLASQGHEVVFASEKLEPALDAKLNDMGQGFVSGKNVRGVTYCDMEFNGVENKEFDILINSLWYHNYIGLPIKITKAVIYWCHMQWVYGIGELSDYCKDNNLAIGFVHISEWERAMCGDITKIALNSTPKVFETLIPNPIMDDIIREISSKNITKKKNKFIFHAAWARGGNVAVDTLRKLDYPDAELHAFDYLMTIHAHQDPWFHIHDGVDKITLFRHLAESEYFLYPLYTPYQDVHKDTFSCVVAEAIALGTIPVTYPLGALPENFDGYCHWANAPAGASFEVMNKEPLSKDIAGIFNNPDMMVEAIKNIEQSPDIKLKVQTQGKDYILNRFSSNIVGEMWTRFIEEITHE